MGGRGLRGSRSIFFFPAGTLCAVLVVGAVVHAQSVLYVDVGAAGPVHDGSSWCSAYLDVQQALGDPLVNDAAAGDEIRVAQGRYTPTTAPDRQASFRLKNGVAILGGFAGCGAPNPDERDFFTHETILSGDLNGDDEPGFVNNGENSVHVVRGSGTDATAVLDGFTITGGHANLGNPSERGAGIFNFNFDLHSPGNHTLRNCIIRGNLATAKAAGMYNDNSSPTIINCVFTGNMAPNAAAIMNFGTSASPTITNSTFTGNVAGINAGGILTTGGNPVMTNCILWGNSDEGGMDESAQMDPGSGNTTIHYSSIQGFTGRFFGGIGNIDTDPLFVDAPGPDGIAGTADDDVRLLPSSPAINTGDPSFVAAMGETDVASQPRVQGCRVDRGAHESAELQLAGDFDNDGGRDLADFAFFQLCFETVARNLSWTDACLCVFDFDGSGEVDLNDYAALQVSLTAP